MITASARRHSPGLNDVLCIIESTAVVRRGPDRIGLLGKPPASSAFLLSIARSRIRAFLRSPHANSGMKQYECGHTQALFHVGHDHGKLALKT
jgi:hypothetical protein